MSRKISDENELDNIPVRKLKALAVKTRIETEFVNGRKQGTCRPIITCVYTVFFYYLF